MKPKKILTIVLLLFVAVSLGWLAIKEIRGSVNSETPSMENGLIVYYFYGNKRCATCKTIEANTNEVLTKDFKDELASGLIQLRLVNLDKPENAHFVEDYAIISSSVLICRFKDGEEQEWKNLTEVWPLADKKEAFVEYVRKEMAALLKEVV